MAEHPELSSLVDQARSGKRESLDELARLAEPRLRSYFYRTLLDKNLTDDLVQEVLLEMIKSISKLKKPESFWPWLLTVASNKLKNYFRSTKRMPHSRFSTIEDYLLDNVVNDNSEPADSLLIKRELSELSELIPALPGTF